MIDKAEYSWKCWIDFSIGNDILPNFRLMTIPFNLLQHFSGSSHFESGILCSCPADFALDVKFNGQTVIKMVNTNNTHHAHISIFFQWKWFFWNFLKKINHQELTISQYFIAYAPVPLLPPLAVLVFYQFRFLSVYFSFASVQHGLLEANGKVKKFREWVERKAFDWAQAI